MCTNQSSLSRLARDGGRRASLPHLPRQAPYLRDAALDPGLPIFSAVKHRALEDTRDPRLLPLLPARTKDAGLSVAEHVGQVGRATLAGLDVLADLRLGRKLYRLVPDACTQR